MRAQALRAEKAWQERLEQRLAEGRAAVESSEPDIVFLYRVLAALRKTS
ncbi:hypothetical protein J7E95_38775 [Streptomyces sp. ISL-14]|nr:hypothetical protein [Streptomyces sp. ISL-14]